MNEAVLIVGGAGCEMPAIVEIVSVHPFAILPLSPGPSSMTYSDHTPLGSVLLKTESVEPNGPTGAGAGKLSPSRELSVRFVGRFVPEIMFAAGTEVAAASDKVNVILFTNPAPQSETSRTFCPDGPTSSTSTSAPQV